MKMNVQNHTPSKRSKIPRALAVLGVALLFYYIVDSDCIAQGTVQPLTITFDGSPVLPPGSAIGVQSYFESGFLFQPIGAVGPGNTFVRVASSPNPGRPDNGTAYLQGPGDTLMFSLTNGGMFSLLFVDLAEYSTVVPNSVTVHFVGYFANGGTITWDAVTDGIIDGTGPLADFQTFQFRGWDNLVRVEIPTYGWSLDNLMLSVPEPTSGILLAIGGLTLVALKLRNRRRE